MQNDELEEVEVQEDDLETTSEDEEQEQEEEKDWKAEAKKWRAEAFKSKGNSKADEKSAQKQSDEFDYGEYAYLAQKGIESDAEIAIVRNAMKDSGKSLRDVVSAKWVQEDLEVAKTSSAVPKGSKSNSTAVDSVEYWQGKDIKDVPANMRQKVVNAKLERENSGGVFYNS